MYPSLTTSEYAKTKHKATIIVKHDRGAHLGKENPLQIGNPGHGMSRDTSLLLLPGYLLRFPFVTIPLL